MSVDNLTREKHRIAAYAICTSSGGLSYLAALHRHRRRSHPRRAGLRQRVGRRRGAGHGIPYRRATLVASRVPSGVGGRLKWVVEVDTPPGDVQGRAFAICHV